MTLYGEMYQIRAGGDYGQYLDYLDYGYTNAPLNCHNDGTYFSQPPGLQVSQA